MPEIKTEILPEIFEVDNRGKAEHESHARLVALAAIITPRFPGRERESRSVNVSTRPGRMLRRTAAGPRRRSNTLSGCSIADA